MSKIPELLYPVKILAVDDEPAILKGLKAKLAGHGYEVRTATGGKQALLELEKERPDLIILDLMMPDMDGLEVLRRVRIQQRDSIPIIVLSARGEEQYKVEALDLGADDYLTKPFGLDELMARLRVAVRHSRPGGSLLRHHEPNKIGDEYLSIDLSLHLVHRDGVELKLTPRQYDLLAYMALHPGKLLSHRLLLQSVWGPEYGNETQYVHVYIGQLRQKIEQDPSQPRYILTEPGLGYRFMLEEPELGT